MAVPLVVVLVVLSTALVAAASADGVMASRLLGPPVDRGMQQERTLLSWERTGLSLVAASLAVGRHALTGAIYAVPCALVAACGVWIYFTSLRQGPRSAILTARAALPARSCTTGTSSPSSRDS